MDKPRCIICARYADRAHIKSVGSGGSDDEFNIIFLCRYHHVLQHSIGWKRMHEKFTDIQRAFDQKGWTFDEYNRIRRV